MTDFITVLSLIGGAAFAISGTVVGVQRRLDIFGCLVLGLLTACGGGVIRDIILGVTPPQIFSDILYVSVCIGTIAATLIVAAIMHGNRQIKHKTLFDGIMNIADAVGLGIFTVLGTLAAINADGGLLLCVFTGTITAVGGGVLRDICALITPLIFRRRIYALPAIGGSICFYLLYQPLGFTPAAIITLFLILTVRVLSAVFRWNLPVIPYNE